jgi:hypothetical protein
VVYFQVGLLTVTTASHTATRFDEAMKRQVSGDHLGIPAVSCCSIAELRFAPLLPLILG